ncbi:GGDEF domain-containing protein [Nitrosophilus labii]|uniref:GGDEF domain-containing protein n=1 Tax=Nitrosophilus labii TaxID=2706014 RepID=UPI001656B072|nr:GGDEF domain-containing protein [Nitrosophilus labii]
MREDIKIKLLQNLLEEITKKYDEFIAMQQDKIEETFEKAIKDPLTGLYNRSYFFEYSRKSFKKAKRKGENIVLIFLDLDNFKYVNDNYGHKRGDEVLKEVANILKNIFREYDVIVRYGGDEFIIFAEFSSKDFGNIDNLLKFFKERVEEKFKKYTLSVSYGIAVFPFDADNIKDLINIADKRMYEQKKQKKMRNYVNKLRRNSFL